MNITSTLELFPPIVLTLLYAAFLIYCRRYLQAQLRNYLRRAHWLYVAAERGILPLQLFLGYQLLLIWFTLVPTNYLDAVFLVNIPSVFGQLLFIWWLWRLISALERNWHLLSIGNFIRLARLDRTSISALTKLFRGILVAALFLIVVDQLGFNISSLLAIGGISGIVIGLAAQEVLSNFFSSIILYLERPFKVGDFITSPDREITGTVGEIGWRRTRLVTLDKRDILVPNHVFNSIAIENFATITHRRIKQHIGLRYQDAGKLETVISAIEEMIATHPSLDQTQQHLVNFDAFGASSLDIQFICYTKTTDFYIHNKVKQDLLLKIVAIVGRQGADFAFPSRTLYIENNSEGD